MLPEKIFGSITREETLFFAELTACLRVAFIDESAEPLPEHLGGRIVRQEITDKTDQLLCRFPVQQVFRFARLFLGQLLRQFQHIAVKQLQRLSNADNFLNEFVSFV